MGAAPLATTTAPATTIIPPGVLQTIQVAGSIPSYLPTNIFRESLTQQLLTRGYDVDRIDITGGYGITSRDYHATLYLRLNARGNVSSVIAAVKSAAEGAGSYTPTASIPAISGLEQAKPATGPIDAVAEILTKAGENVAELPKDLKQVSIWIVVGLVAIVALVAFGPNVRSIAGAARR